MSSSPIVSSRRSASTSTTTTSNTGFKVDKGGYGLLFGDEHGATPGEIHLEGAVKWLTPGTGKIQTPVIGTEDGIFCLGKILVDTYAQSGTQFDILGGVKGCVITEILIKRPNGVLPDGLKGKIYTSPFPWTEESAVTAEFDLSGMNGYMIKRVPALEKLYEPVFFHYRPTGTRGTIGLTFELEVYGYSEWYSNLPKPLAPVS